MRRSHLLALVLPIAACTGLKDAFSRNVDVVARAGGQALSVERLGGLIGSSGAPISPQVARTIADLWVNYQLLGTSAARSDSLADPAAVDTALASVFGRMLVDKWQREFLPTLRAKVDTTQFPQLYANGTILHARHILVRVPETATPAQKAEAKAKADRLRAKVTVATFADVAKRESQDPGSAANGGLLGAFPKGAMVPPFEAGVLATAPGAISPVVESSFGYHIIYRSPWEEARGEVGNQLRQQLQQSAESTFVVGLEERAKVSLKADAVAKLRAGLEDFAAARENGAVLADVQGGDYRVRDAAVFLQGIPQRGQLVAQMATAPDSIVRDQMLRPLIRSELVMRAAREGGTKLDTAEVAQVRRTFAAALQAAWSGLGVSPSALADSAKTPEARAALAAGRVEAAIDRIVAGQASMVQVPIPVEVALHMKYRPTVSAAGIDRAVEQAKKVRAQADSARNAAVPPSAVPLPGGADKALPTPAPSSKPPAAGPAGTPPATKRPE